MTLNVKISYNSGIGCVYRTFTSLSRANSLVRVQVRVKQLTNGVTARAATSAAHYRYYFVEKCLSARHGRNWRTKLRPLSRLNSIRRPPRPSVSYADVCFESLTHYETPRHFCPLFKDAILKKIATATHSRNYLWREASCLFISVIYRIFVSQQFCKRNRFEIISLKFSI